MKTKLNGISDNANNYSLPTATSSILGGVKSGGANIDINSNGVISATNTTYSVGDGGLTQNNFTNTLKTKLDGIDANANNYSLPTATSSILGGVKIGTGLSITDDVVSISNLSKWSDGSESGEIYYTGGNVGIGTNNPSYRLHVHGSTSSGETNLLELKSYQNNNTTNPGGTINFSVNSSSGYIVSHSIDNTGYKIISDSSARSIILGTSNTERLRIDEGGNVGIGTTSPEAKLDIFHSTTATNKTALNLGLGDSSTGLYNLNQITFSFTEGVDNYRHLIKTRHQAGAVATQNAIDFYLWKNGQSMGDIGNTHGMSITAGGVGIGTTTPNYMLHVKRTTGNWAGQFEAGSTNIYLSHKDGYGMHIQGGSTSSAVYAFRVYSSNNSCLLNVTSDGNVGIGTESPDAALEITTTGPNITKSGNTVVTSYSYYSSNSTTSPYGIRVFEPVSQSGNWSLIVAGRTWIGGTLFVVSDERIKNSITDISDNISLQKLRDISCVSYKYNDYIQRGSDETIGFIAQQVKEVMPNAISIAKKIIPNEMRLVTDISWNDIICDNSNNIIDNHTYDASNNKTSYDKYKLTIHDLSDNSGNQLYKFYMSNDISGNDEIEKTCYSMDSDPKSFIFDTSWNNIFLYGKEINDLNVLDKQKLFALNFSATQEIDRQQQADKLRIAALEAEVETLKTENTDIKARLAAIEEQLGIS